MNINFNTNIKTQSTQTTSVQADQAGRVATAGAKRPEDLSITTAKAAPGDVPEIDFPENENSVRSDRLGQLVSAAFNLPAPPPDFKDRA